MMLGNMWKGLFVFISIILIGTLSAQANASPMNTAVLQGLDKVTARISTFEIGLNETVRFGALSITLRSCDRTPPEDPPESAAFLEIDDIKLGQQPVRVFSGWMFASSPALSAVEHAVYDVWVLKCVERVREKQPVQSGEGEGNTPAQQDGASLPPVAQ